MEESDFIRILDKAHADGLSTEMQLIHAKVYIVAKDEENVILRSMASSLKLAIQKLQEIITIQQEMLELYEPSEPEEPVTLKVDNVILFRKKHANNR